MNLTVQVQVLSLTLEMNCSHAGILLFKIDSSYIGIIAVSKTVETGSIPVGSVVIAKTLKLGVQFGYERKGCANH